MEEEDQEEEEEEEEHRSLVGGDRGAGASIASSTTTKASLPPSLDPLLHPSMDFMEPDFVHCVWTRSCYTRNENENERSICDAKFI